MKSSYIRTIPFVFIGSIPAILSAQAVSPVGNGRTGMPFIWAPWEAAVSVNWTRANFSVMSDSLNVINEGSNAPMVSNSWFNTWGSDVALQQNYRGWLGFQIEASAGAGSCDVKKQDGTEYKLAPKYLAFTYGPVITRRTAHRTNLWVRGLLGVGRQDLSPDAAFKADVRASQPKYEFADTGIAIPGGAGIDRAINSKMLFRWAVDDIHTQLFNTGQNHWRTGVGFAWGWGRGSSD